MPEIGQTFLHYSIVEKIGKGGMGEVFRAKDQKLGRDVAIKVLPEEFAKDADRVARFQREAKLLASLNHPNIAAIHGLEESDSTHFLVLELIEGDTLAERIGGIRAALQMGPEATGSPQSLIMGYMLTCLADFLNIRRRFYCSLNQKYWNSACLSLFRRLASAV
jgi:serine/threonine protein kinase